MSIAFIHFWRQICVKDFESVPSLKEYDKILNVTWFQFQLLYCSNEGLGRLVFVHYGGESPGKCLLLLGFSLNVLELTLARKQMSNFARWAEQYTICTICNPSLTIFWWNLGLGWVRVNDAAHGGAVLWPDHYLEGYCSLFLIMSFFNLKWLVKTEGHQPTQPSCSFLKVFFLL